MQGIYYYKEKIFTVRKADMKKRKQMMSPEMCELLVRPYSLRLCISIIKLLYSPVYRATTTDFHPLC